jgi:hypothetical protein
MTVQLVRIVADYVRNAMETGMQFLGTPGREMDSPESRAWYAGLATAQYPDVCPKPGAGDLNEGFCVAVWNRHDEPAMRNPAPVAVRASTV